MANKRLLDAIERGFDIGRRVGVFAFPITERSRVTSSCAGEPGCDSAAAEATVCPSPAEAELGVGLPPSFCAKSSKDST